MSKGEIISTSLWDDILSVTGTTDRSRVLRLFITIHTEKEDFQPMKVLVYENLRDYYKDTGETFHIRVMMTFGDYIYRVIPFKDNLEISLTTSWMFEGGDENEDLPPKEVRYKALLDTQKNPFFGSQSLTNRSNIDLNHMPLQEINFELVDRREELLRLKTVSGIYRNISVEQVLRGVFFHEANKIKIDGKNSVEVLDLDSPDQKNSVPELLLPSGLLLRDLPGFMQEKAKGVYSAGIGSFFQVYRDNPSWFVYPLYRPERFDEDRYKLIIYAVPEERMPSHDHTYRVEGKIVYIVTTGAKSEIDPARMSELNSGVGFRMPNAESFMTKPVEILEDGIKANRHRLNYEVQNHNRKDQVLYASMKKPGSNPFMEYSRILAQDFTGLSISWQNSDPDLLYPGMPVKYVTMDKGQYLERKGTLVKVMNVTAIQGNPTVDTVHRCSSQLYMMLETKEYLPDNDIEESVGEEQH